MIKTALRRFRSLFTRVHELHNGLDNFPYFFKRSDYEKIIFSDAPRGVCDRDYCGYPIVVSLTSYGRRLVDACFAIESIMQQSWKANRIVLWLSPEDMRSPLPEALVRQQARGLEIKETPDIRSYKKLIPALNEMPDAGIITIDDDMIYDFDLIERLIKKAIEKQGHIVSTKSYRVGLRKNGKTEPYNKWSWHNDTPAEAGPQTFILGGAGTLYPPGSLDPRVTETELCLSLCPYADDIWFNIMARLKGTPIAKIHTRHLWGQEYIDNRNVLDNGLAQRNVDAGENDHQLQAVLDYFKLDAKSLFS